MIKKEFDDILEKTSKGLFTDIPEDKIKVIALSLLFIARILFDWSQKDCSH